MGFNCWTYVFMIYTIVQSIIHILTPIAEILLYNCYEIIDYAHFGNNAPDAILMYMMYFMNIHCFHMPDYITNLESVLRTMRIAISYIVFDSAWILLSLMILIVLCCKRDRSPKTYLKIIYILWNVIALGEFALDLSGAIMYGLDISEAETYNKYFENVIHTDLSIPPTIMAIISVRFGLFLLLNITMQICMIIITVRYMRDETKIENQRTVPLKPPKSVIRQPRIPYLEETNKPRVDNWYKHYEEKPNHFFASDFENPTSKPVKDRSNWNSNSHPTSFVNNTNVMVNGITSGTLRRQLPWTYISDQELRPNQMQQSRQKLNASPPVPPPLPPPDYTIRLPRTFALTLQEQGWTEYS